MVAVRHKDSGKPRTTRALPSAICRRHGQNPSPFIEVLTLTLSYDGERGAISVERVTTILGRAAGLGSLSCIVASGDRIEETSMKTLSKAALAIALLAVSAPAGAADLTPILDPAKSAFNWSGFYAGAQFGYGWGNDKTVEYLTGTDILTGLAYKLPSRGALGGVFAGYNYEMDSIVVGAEADIEAADIRGHFFDKLTALGAGTSQIDGEGSVRARLGLAVFDRSLFYVTAGAAFANVNYVYKRLFPPQVDEPVSNFRAGWTIGAGLEYALTDNITLRGEYRYADYGTFRNESHTAFGPGVLPVPANVGLTGEQHPTTSTVRLGVAYKF